GVSSEIGGRRLDRLSGPAVGGESVRAPAGGVLGGASIGGGPAGGGAPAAEIHAGWWAGAGRGGPPKRNRARSGGGRAWSRGAARGAGRSTASCWDIFA